MVESSFSPAYALPTQHPYAQWAGKATYPGPSVLAVKGALTNGLRGIGFLGGLVASFYALDKFKTTKKWNGFVKFLVSLVAAGVLAETLKGVGQVIQGQQG